MQHIIIRNFQAVFARASSTPRAKRKAHLRRTHERYITSYTHLVQCRGLHLARNFTGNPCGINGGNAQFKPRRATRKSVEYHIWDCLRLTKYASSWFNGNDLIIRTTMNDQFAFPQNPHCGLSLPVYRHQRNEHLWLRRGNVTKNVLSQISQINFFAYNLLYARVM